MLRFLLFFFMGISLVTSITIVVITPLIPLDDFPRLKEFVCTLASAGGMITLLEGSSDQYMDCLIHENIVLPMLSSPYKYVSIDDNDEMPPLAELHQSFPIRSPKYARLALLMQNASQLSGIDIFLKYMENADIVVIGSNIRSYPFSFLQYVLSIVQNPPLCIEFSKVSDLLPLTLPSFLERIQYSTFKRKGHLSWVSCSVLQCADTASGVGSDECGVCMWRQRFGNVFDDETLRMLSATAQRAAIERKNSDKKVTCEYTPDELFHADGSDIIARMTTFGTNYTITNGPASNSEVPDESLSQVHHHQNSSSLKILCMIYSRLSNQEAIQAIRDTWASHCDGFLAFTDNTNLSLSAIGIEPPNKKEILFKESYSVMWQKVQLIWIIVGSSRLIDEYDYFLIGGDDLFVAVDNLREFLQSDRIKSITGIDGRHPVYIGREMKHNAYLRFNTGGAGYLLNKAAVATLYGPLVNLMQRDDAEDTCLTTLRVFFEDVMVGACMQQYGIRPVSTTSIYDGLEMFHPVEPFVAYHADTQPWFTRMAMSYKTGTECCSRKSISFHDIKTPVRMTCLYKYIYG